MNAKPDQVAGPAKGAAEENTMAGTQSSWWADRFPEALLFFAWSPRGEVVVRLRGEYDCATVPVLAEILATVAALDDADVVIGVNGVRFMDSSTIRLFEQTAAFLACRSRTLVLRSPSAFIRRTIDLCGASALIEAAFVPTPHLFGGSTSRIAKWQRLVDSDRVHHSFDNYAPSALSFPSIPLFDSFVREPGPIKEGVCHEGHRRH